MPSLPSRSSLAAALATIGLVGSVLPAAAATGDDVPDHLDPAYLRAIDTATVSGTITPPGSPIEEKQAELNAYDDLVQGYRDLTPDQLTETYFKDGAWGELEVDREYSPRADVTIRRDARWGDPHIYGQTDLGAAFGAGYVAAEDRLPILVLLRALGRAEAFELLGNNQAYLMDAELVRLYGYTEEEFQAQIDRIPAEFGQAGQDLVDYLEQLVKGINTYLVDAKQGRVPVPAALADIAPVGEVPAFTTTDIVAIVAIVRALFGAGGGDELGAAARWTELVAEYGEQDAASVYEDFRNRFNLDGPLHTLDEQFSYMQPPIPLTEADSAPGNVLGYGPGDPGLQARFEQLGNLFTGMSASEAASDLAALHEASRIRWEDMVLETPAGVDRPVALGPWLDEQLPRRRRVAHDVGSPDPARRAAGRLLRPADPDGEHHPLAEPARRRLHLPRLRPGHRRPHPGLRMVAHRRRQRHDRHLRRGAVRAGRLRTRPRRPTTTCSMLTVKGVPTPSACRWTAAWSSEAPDQLQGVAAGHLRRAHRARPGHRPGIAGRHAGRGQPQALDLPQGAGPGRLDPQAEPQRGDHR